MNREAGNQPKSTVVCNNSNRKFLVSTYVDGGNFLLRIVIWSNFLFDPAD